MVFKRGRRSIREAYEERFSSTDGREVRGDVVLHANNIFLSLCSLFISCCSFLKGSKIKNLALVSSHSSPVYPSGLIWCALTLFSDNQR